MMPQFVPSLVAGRIILDDSPGSYLKVVSSNLTCTHLRNARNRQVTGILVPTVDATGNAGK